MQRIIVWLLNWLIVGWVSRQLFFFLMGVLILRWFQLLQSEMEKLHGKLLDYVKQQKVMRTDMQTRVQKLKVGSFYMCFNMMEQSEMMCCFVHTKHWR